MNINDLLNVKLIDIHHALDKESKDFEFETDELSRIYATPVVSDLELNVRNDVLSWGKERGLNQYPFKAQVLAYWHEKLST